MAAGFIEIHPGEGVRIYSLKKDGAKRFCIVKGEPFNFIVKEFACHDGSDEIKIDSDLVIALQNIRNNFNSPVIINSAYRTPSYNKKIGGAPRSQHIYGKAADITVKGVKPLTIAQYTEVNIDTIKGIGLYKDFTHIDTRKNKYYWDNRSGSEVAVDTFINTSKPPVAVPVLRKGSRGLQVSYLQADLVYVGYKVSIDGIFGINTEAAVKAFQREVNIAADGIYGALTRAKMRERIDS